MKRLLLLSFALVLLAGLCFAEPVEIKVWHYWGGFEAVPFQAVIDGFNASQNKAHAVAQYLPREELNRQYTIGLAGGNLPDIAMVDNPDHASYAAMGLFLDITDRVKAWEGNGKFFEGPWLSCTYQGKVYGVPQNSNCLALYYNVDMLKAAGVNPPATWDELAAAAKKLTKPGVYALAISAIGNEEGTFQYLPWLLSSGATITKLDSPESVKSLTFLTNLVKNGFMSSEVINWTQADAEKQFATGRAAMMVNGPWNLQAVQTDAPNMNWYLAKIPKDKKYTSVLGGENMGITATSQYPNEAWAFLKYMSGTSVMETYMTTSGKFPPRSDVMNGSDFWKSDRLLKVFADQMQYAMPRGPHPRWPDISNAISTALQEALSKTKTPAQALKDAQGKVTKALSN
jgi:multiple sugar transport system substrate-binding protein